jgi:hypothetical protein
MFILWGVAHVIQFFGAPMQGFTEFIFVFS